MLMRRRIRALAILVAAVLQAPAGAQQSPSADGVPLGDPLRDTIAAMLRTDRWPLSLSRPQRELVRTLYAGRDAAPLWVAGVGLDRRAATLLDAVTHAHTEALALESYSLDSLRRLLTALRPPAPTTAARAAADIALTSAYAAFAHDRLTGQLDPGSVEQAWHIQPRRAEADSTAIRALSAPSFDSALAQLRPGDPAYGALVEALAHYRGLAERGGWRDVPGGNTIRPGDTTSLNRLERLAERLQVEGLLDSGIRPASLPQDSLVQVGDSSAKAVYEGPLTAAVAHYQSRRGLVVDSIVGPNTLASLNRSAEYRTRQIAANLERHRWLPRSLGSRFILVNVPAFRLTAFDSGRQVLSMKVVVGAEYGGRSTPVFADLMSYVVFRPYWNVPQSIASSELWPAQRRDPGFFARHGYEVAQESWGRYVRQKPGPENALGRVKFIFPNDFAIYLHDTPADELFEEDVRAVSHGCIRVERPGDLARYVLGWDSLRVQDAMHNGPDDRRVDLDRKLPVYIVYFTTYTRDGELRFANDIYDRDAALVRAIRGAAMPSAATLRVAEAVRELARELTR